MTKIEQVELAIARFWGEKGSPKDAARAAIEAIRGPTEEMIEREIERRYPITYRIGVNLNAIRKIIIDDYNAMIDAVLEGK